MQDLGVGPLSNSFMTSSYSVNRATTFLRKCPSWIPRNTANYWRWFVCRWYHKSILFIWWGVGLSHVSPSFVHVYD